MIIVAVLVLPAAGFLLLGMDRIEEWLSRPPADALQPDTAVAAAPRTGLHLVPRSPHDPEEALGGTEPAEKRRHAA
ncbi:hypothetical protein RVR_356 [Actinacidiphila reveromycinica]|uniref:Uncharacterized protein n=1 Tax=Actinacidiphila reveromycinica TaxID=659352 RepID=A0A7U3UMW9_9ACTN|nr:hypothetical protein [Streptomyces sp. SN-593]BBA95478.1 hypothetical protein RVR_356 [Streptomyces sp. SN-593]